MESRTPYSLQTPEWLVFLRLVCAIAEGSFDTVFEHTPALADAARCVYTVLSDSQSRLTVMGGRENMPRSLGSVYSGAVTRCLGGFRGRFTRAITTHATIPCHSAGAVSRDGALLLVPEYYYGVHALRIFSVHTGAFLRTIGCFGAGPLQFKFPYRVWVASDGFVFVTECYNLRIQILTPHLDFHAFVGVGQLSRPTDVCADDETIIVSESSEDRVSVFKRCDGALLRRFGSRGSGDGELFAPFGVCFLTGTRHVAVTEDQNSRVSVWTLDGEFVRHVGAGKLAGPRGIACTDASELVVADYMRIVVFSACGEIVWSSDANDFIDVTLHGSTIYGQSAQTGKCAVFS